jgi:DMSO/TMAO reductase YedYZ molybdopterin-dependent catalytic subunit
LTQGLHVDLGFVLIPLLLAKLWSVLPKLFVWPPARSLTDVASRLSLGLLVGSVLFEFVTGVLNVQYDYVFGFDFYTAHYFGAWVFIGALLAHVATRLPRMVRALRSRVVTADDELAAKAPTAPTISRRGALGLIGGGMAGIAVLTVGQSIGGPTRRLALLLPRGRSLGSGPNAFQVNKTAAAAGITAAHIGPQWRLKLTGGASSMTLDRAALLALPQHQATLPIACVEGWSTGNQAWTGVRLRDLARLAGISHPASVLVDSLEEGETFRHAVLSAGQIMDPDSLLALRVNGADLSPDHGYPARIIVPADPGVHNTK